MHRAKSVLKDPRTLALNPESYFEERAARAYERYEELLGQNNGVDFDDLLMKAVHLFRSDPQVLGRYQQRFLHLMIDEFQDTNVAQYALAKLLAAEYRNVCAVGDPDQSIYSWRNADIRNILSFQQDFPEAKTINLEENYRSTSTILEAAKGIISANHMRLEKELRTQREAGPPIIVHEAHTEEEEAQYALSEVLRLKKEGFTPRDCAVMYRVNAQSRALEEACLRTGVPYQIVGGVRFYQRREVKELMCYLRLIANPHDSVSLGRVVNTPPRGIGQRSLEELDRWAQTQGISLFTAIEAMAAGQPSGLSLSPRATAAIASFAHLIQQMAERSRQLDIVDLLDELVERTAYRQYLLERTDNGEERWENVMELREVAQEFRDMESPEGLHALLERFALVADVDGYDQSVEALTLITLHQAKGLEFPVVFLVGMEEGLLPHVRSMDDPAQLEEERRLCYVGTTRAKERVYMLRSFHRGMRGTTGPTVPSRFLQEVPQHLIQAPVAPTPPARAPWGRWEPTTAPSSQPTPLALKAGDKVRHATFGEGILVSCQPEGQDDLLVTVAFKDGAGIKRLLLSFAPLEKL